MNSHLKPGLRHVQTLHIDELLTVPAVSHADRSRPVQRARREETAPGYWRPAQVWRAGGATLIAFSAWACGT
jgi:hypothetical protein